MAGEPSREKAKKRYHGDNAGGDGQGPRKRRTEMPTGRGKAAASSKVPIPTIGPALAASIPNVKYIPEEGWSQEAYDQVVIEWGQVVGGRNMAKEQNNKMVKLFKFTFCHMKVLTVVCTKFNLVHVKKNQAGRWEINHGAWSEGMCETLTKLVAHDMWENDAHKLAAAIQYTVVCRTASGVGWLPPKDIGVPFLATLRDLLIQQPAKLPYEVAKMAIRSTKGDLDQSWQELFRCIEKETKSTRRPFTKSNVAAAATTDGNEDASAARQVRDGMFPVEAYVMSALAKSLDSMENDPEEFEYCSDAEKRKDKERNRKCSPTSEELPKVRKLLILGDMLAVAKAKAQNKRGEGRRPGSDIGGGTEAAGDRMDYTPAAAQIDGDQGEQRETWGPLASDRSGVIRGLAAPIENVNRQLPRKPAADDAYPRSGVETMNATAGPVPDEGHMDVYSHLWDENGTMAIDPTLGGGDASESAWRGNEATVASVAPVPEEGHMDADSPFPPGGPVDVDTCSKPRDEMMSPPVPPMPDGDYTEADTWVGDDGMTSPTVPVLYRDDFGANTEPPDEMMGSPSSHVQSRANTDAKMQRSGGTTGVPMPLQTDKGDGRQTDTARPSPPPPPPNPMTDESRPTAILNTDNMVLERRMSQKELVTGRRTMRRRAGGTVVH